MSFCYIKQPAGLGDILFCQKIANQISSKYSCDIVWPVIPEFLFLSNYISNVTFCNSQHTFLPTGSNIIQNEDFIYVPLQTADQLISGSVMTAKYKFVGLDYTDWADYLQIKRNYERESALKKLLLHNDDPYVFVNRWYGSPPNSIRCKYLDNVKFNRQVVELDFIDGFNLFDWMGILESAEEIHTVETSLNFIIEKLNLSNTLLDNLYMYSKHTPPSFDQVDMLFKKPWKYIK